VANLGRAIDQFAFGSRFRSRDARRQADALITRLRSRVRVEIRPLVGTSSTALAELCDLYGSDKGTAGSPAVTFPWKSHEYCDVYTELFEAKRTEIRSVFECGIGTNNPALAGNMTREGRPGASLRVWRDYFPNASVIGADIDEDTLFTDDRITTLRLDQCDPESILAVWSFIGPEKVDIMIDDGLHRYHAGRCLFENSVDYLADDGIYVIEDVGISDLEAYAEYFADGVPRSGGRSTLEATFVLFYDEKRFRFNWDSLIVLR
jgi:hypothetical protein